MNEIETLSNRLTQTFIKSKKFGPTISEGTFHGPSLMDSLAGINFNEAKRRVIQGRHSIWEIVNHCSYWMEEFTSSLEGIPIKDVYEYEDWPATGSNRNEWEKDNERLTIAYTNLKNEIIKMEKKRLNEIVNCSFHNVVFQFTIRKMLYGLIDHNLYHTGQISILRE